MHDAVVKSGMNHMSKHQIQPDEQRMSELARDGTAKPVLRD